MKYLKIPRSVALLAVAVTTFGCQDLALEPTAAISNDAYFKTIGDFRAAIVGVYDQISIADYYGRSLHLMSDIMGNDVKQAGSANRYQEFADFEGQVVTGHGYETELWAEGYEGINMLNMIINAEFDAPGGVAAEYNQIMGEAYALRGLIYHDLVKMYAQHYTFTAGASHPGVPIITESDVTALPSRNTVAEVYAQAISDLTTGISMMNQTRNGAFMMTREGAQAILSRIYLYMEDWSNAESAASAIISSGKFSLTSGQAYIDQFTTGASSEAIFEIQSTDTDNRGSDALGRMYTANGYGDYLPSRALLNLYEAGDIRLDFYVTDPLLTGAYASHRVNKWPSRTANVPVIRLSELYLNRAEARARTGNTGGAQADLNMIRTRAGATASAATGQALIDAILLERRLELGYEGHSIHDLMRNKMGISRSVDVTGDVATMAYPCNFCVLPIPQPETDVNPNMSQNAGY